MKAHIRPQLVCVILILIGLMHGLVYVFLIPPWQHYDEPTHFEYAWLLANRMRIPAAGDYDPIMRREVALSMIEHGFYRGLGYLPDLNVADGMVSIGGYSQLDEPPVYYMLAAVPIGLLKNQPVTTQLYGARLVSLGLLVLSIWAIHGMVCEMTSANSALRWIIPGGVALLPGYVELMSAVNNDVGAAALMSLVLWGAVRLVKRGWQWWTVVWSGVAAVLCLLTKETAYLAVPIWMLGVILSLFRRRWAYVVWVGLVVGGVVAFASIFGWGDAQRWYRVTDQQPGTRSVNGNAPIGGAVFSLQPGATGQAGMFILNQLVPVESMRGLRGQVVTVGAWIWSDEPLRISMPVLTAVKADRGIDRTQHSIEVDTIPKFYAYQATIPENTSSLQISFGDWEEGTYLGGMVYFDGVVLAQGEYPISEAPSWDDALAQAGTWGGISVFNLVRNASAEAEGPRVRPWVDQLGSRIIPDNGRPSILLYSLCDYQSTGSYYQSTIKMMHQTFWGRFAWGHVLLEGKAIYNILMWVSVLGLVGCCAVIWQKMPQNQVSALVLMGLAMLLVWGIAIVRGAIYLFHWPFIPGARYAFPVVGPTMGMLGYGWWSILGLLRKGLRVREEILAGLLGLGLLSLDVWSLVSIWRYYVG